MALLSRRKSNPLDVLGISPELVIRLRKQRSIARVARHVFMELASVHHPDKGGDAAVFQVFDQAYKALQDESVLKRSVKELIDRNTAKAAERQLIEEAARADEFWATKLVRYATVMPNTSWSGRLLVSCAPMLSVGDRSSIETALAEIDKSLGRVATDDEVVLDVVIEDGRMTVSQLVREPVKGGPRGMEFGQPVFSNGYWYERTFTPDEKLARFVYRPTGVVREVGYLGYCDEFLDAPEQMFVDREQEAVLALSAGAGGAAPSRLLGNGVMPKAVIPLLRALDMVGRHAPSGVLVGCYDDNGPKVLIVGMVVAVA